MHQINIWKISWLIALFNVNSPVNKASQILEVVNVVLQYKIYSE